MDMAYQSDAFAVTLDKGHDSTWEVKVDAVAGRAAAMLSNLPG
jgi:hypothetical protein